MRKADALLHFGNNQSALARALGITRATVNAWPEVVPLVQARALEIRTRGDVKVDEALYPPIRLAHEVTARSA